MKILFLDSDGVLNNDTTKERVTGNSLFNNLMGIDETLLQRYLTWLRDKPYSVVLSSTWRHHPFMKEHLQSRGITWISETPRLGFRGNEVEKWLEAHPDVSSYAILDDNTWFHDYQFKYFVKTDPVVGVTDNDLSKVDRILNGNVVV